MDDEKTNDNEIKSIVITHGRNVKVGLPNYSSEDIYEGVKVVIPVEGNITPEKVKKLYEEYTPVVEEIVDKAILARAEAIRDRNNLTSKIDAPRIVKSGKGKVPPTE